MRRHATSSGSVQTIANILRCKVNTTFAQFNGAHLHPTPGHISRAMRLCKRALERFVCQRCLLQLRTMAVLHAWCTDCRDGRRFTIKCILEDFFPQVPLLLEFVLALGIAAEQFFCINIEYIVQHLRLSHNIAVHFASSALRFVFVCRALPFSLSATERPTFSAL